MNLPQIQLQSTFAKIDIHTKNAQLTIEQPPVEVSIERPKAEMEVVKTPSRLTIDQTKVRAEVNLKSTSQFNAEAAQEGQQDVLEGIARRAQEGDQLMEIEHGGNAVAEIAKQHHAVPEHEFGLGWVPSWGSVQINYDPGNVDINWKINKPIINSQTHKPVINYYPGKVDFNMKQYPSLNVDISL